MTVQSVESKIISSDALHDSDAPPVKNTFVHFDTTSPLAPGPPQLLLRLHTCPAEVGIAYFFEKIGRGVSGGSSCCTPAVGSRSPAPSALAEKTIVLAEEKTEQQSAENEEEEDKQAMKAAVEEERREVGQQEGLGEFFVVQKKKKRRFSGSKSGHQDEEVIMTQTTTTKKTDKEEQEEVAATAGVPTPAIEEDVKRPVAEETEKEDVSKEELHPARPRWADLEEDTSPMTTASAALAPPLPTRNNAAAEERPAQRRPVFARPGREARTQQARKDAEEICSLEFDAVDAAAQMGLTGRMLVMLKSLAQMVVFWEDGEEKREEEKFRLLGLEEDDMYAIGKRIRRAGKKIDERNFREAFEQMCEARRWLQDPEWAAAERGRRAEKPARAREEEEPTKASTRKKNKPTTTTTTTAVAKKGEPAVLAEILDEDEEWQVVGAAGGTDKKKKMTKEREMIQQQVVTAAPTNTVRGTTTGRRCGAEEPKQKLAPPSTKTQQQQQRPNAAASTSMAPCRSTTGAPREGTKFLCRFFVGIEAEVKGNFRVCRRIFGPGGENMKSIARTTNAKLRLRGRGSGFKEGPELREADEPLMLCVSAEDPEGYRKAVVQVTELFERIYEEYQEHCKRHRLPEAASRPSVQLKEHPGNPPY